MIRVGHRGAAGHVLENTLDSITRAIELGVDYVEVDVQRTRDGRLVIMHDPTVNRTTTGRGKVAALTLDEIKQLRTRDGQRVPTLEELLAHCHGRVGVMVELKVIGIAESCVAAVVASRFHGPVVYASFYHDELRRVRTRLASAAIMPLISRGRLVIRRLVQLQAGVVGIRFERLTAEVVHRCRTAGLQLAAYTVNRPDDIATMRRLGIDWLISDYPDLLAR